MKAPSILPRLDGAIRTDDTPFVTPLQKVHPEPVRVLKMLRRVLSGILAFGLGGTGIELLLLEHTEGFWQKVPLVLIVLSLAAMLTLAVFPRTFTVRVFQITMMLLLAGGIAGLIMHFNGNMEFELEMHPGQTGFKLYWETLKGATPALAPGMFLLLGCLGLTCAYLHPALTTPVREKIN
jgi:hypothetical protein